MGDVTTQGLWNLAERKLHINILDLLAVQISLSALLSDVHGQHVRVESDNTTVISYSNSIGGGGGGEGHSLECDTVTKDIWTWAIANNIWLSAAFISKKINPVADKLPSYVSWKPDPHVSFVDAFSINWAQFTHGHAFPPFCLTSRCLQKIIHEMATVTMIVPMWTTQPWFTDVLNLLIDYPRVFQVTDVVLSILFSILFYPLSPKLYLMACKLSGVISLTTAFLRTLPKSSCLSGSQVHKSNTMCTFTNGSNFVPKGMLIHCLPL